MSRHHFNFVSRSTGMTRKGLMALLMVCLVVGVVGCKKKAPVTDDSMVIKPSTAEPAQPPPPPEPTIGGDQTPDPLSGDLQEAAEYAMRQGLLGDIFFDYD